MIFPARKKSRLTGKNFKTVTLKQRDDFLKTFKTPLVPLTVLKRNKQKRLSGTARQPG
jgi:hypothetical protein